MDERPSAAAIDAAATRRATTGRAGLDVSGRHERVLPRSGGPVGLGRDAGRATRGRPPRVAVVAGEDALGVAGGAAATVTTASAVAAEERQRHRDGDEHARAEEDERQQEALAARAALVAADRARTGGGRD